MVISGAFEGLCALAIAIAGGIYLIGQVKENARKNEKDIKDIKEMMSEFQKSMMDLLAKSMDDVKQMIDKEKDHSRENLSREVSHIKDILNITANETRADIQRLEQRQAESNRVKERLAIAENSLKSLHHRLDIDPPNLLPREDEN